MPRYLCFFWVAAVIGCGGGEKKVVEPTDEPADTDGETSGDDDGTLIPPEKFDEIKRTFERKQTQISRCFVVGVDAGEVGKNDRGEVTVSATITQGGKPTNVRVVETSFKSTALEQCVKDHVGKWLFTTLPKELEYSYTYRLESF